MRGVLSPPVKGCVRLGYWAPCPLTSTRQYKEDFFSFMDVLK